jgi:hypothetical protein
MANSACLWLCSYCQRARVPRFRTLGVMSQGLESKSGSNGRSFTNRFRALSGATNLHSFRRNSPSRDIRSLVELGSFTLCISLGKKGSLIGRASPDPMLDCTQLVLNIVNPSVVDKQPILARQVAPNVSDDQKSRNYGLRYVASLQARPKSVLSIHQDLDAGLELGYDRRS